MSCAAPRVTICLPAYNARQFLEETLRSVEAQSFADWELTVVEDGSAEPCRDIVEAFAEQVEQPVRYVEHAQNQGLSATRNTAMQRSEAEFIALIDADDLWETDHLARLVAVLEETGADFASASSRVFDSASGKTLYLRELPEGLVERAGEKIFRGELIAQPSAVLMRRSIPQAIGGFRVGMKMCEDLDYWLRALRAGFQLVGSAPATCHYRKHEEAMTSASARLIAQAGRVKMQHAGWLELPLDLRYSLPFKHLFWSARMESKTRPLTALRLLGEGLLYVALVPFGRPRYEPMQPWTSS